jgi:hypothetical protein
MGQDELERREQFRRRLAQSIIVAFPRGERAALAAPDLDLIEAGIVVVAAEVEFDEIVLVEPAGELERLLQRLGLEVADGVVGGGEKFGAVRFGHDVISLFGEWPSWRMPRLHAARRSPGSSVCGCRLLRKSAAFWAWLAAVKIARASFFKTVSQL